MRDDRFFVRLAEPSDIPVIMELLRELAEYERIELRADGEGLKRALFDVRAAEAFLGYENERAVALAICYPHFATFQAAVTLYMEELIVRRDARGKGYGKLMMKYLALIAKERGMIRMEWPCMHWNHETLNFYKHIGGRILDDRVLLRIEGEKLDRLAAYMLDDNPLPG